MYVLWTGLSAEEEDGAIWILELDGTRAGHLRGMRVLGYFTFCWYIVVSSQQYLVAICTKQLACSGMQQSRSLRVKEQAATAPVAGEKGEVKAKNAAVDAPL
jgi:hypothetical protein